MIYPTYGGGTQVEIQLTNRYTFARDMPNVPANMTRVISNEAEDIVVIVNEALAVAKKI